MSKEPEHVRVHVTLKGSDGISGESMWAFDLGDGRCQIDNIPFFAYGLNLGDVVRVAEHEGFRREVMENVEKSGNRTFRVALEKGCSEESAEALVTKLRRMGVRLERGFSILLALSVPPEANYKAVRRCLLEWQATGRIDFEIADERVPGRFDEWEEDPTH